jgi:pimeloyl-ACP methyl ester carboxylesterase
MARSSRTTSLPTLPAALDAPRRRGRKTAILGAAALAVGAAAAYRRFAADQGTDSSDLSHDEATAALGWGELDSPVHRLVATPDGAQLAVWDIGDAAAPVVVLPHCWGCSHAIWIPVARRLLEAGNRVVLYDQRGHGQSGRGTVPLSIESLANDLATVLQATDVHDAVLAGHSMGGMTIMSLATYRPEVLHARARAVVLVATAAAQMGLSVALPGVEEAAGRLIASPLVTRFMHSPSGHRYVRGVFGTAPVKAHLDLTRQLFGDCPGAVRGGYLGAMTAMNLLEGIATIELPTTVLVGSRDRLTSPARAAQMVAAIPGARLVTLADRGHMLPLEDPDIVADEIQRAVKG